MIIASRSAFIVAGLAAGLGSTAATAQDAGNLTNQGIGEIIVTAQRVQESLQKVPVAVTSFDSEDLKKSSIETVNDIALRTPGFTAGGSNPVELNLAVRGIGSAQGISQNAGGDTSVVVFVDGVYVGRGGTPDIDALDLERVEILRGPQGTLFGKNAIGGLVNFVSRKPNDDNRFHAEITGGNYDRFDGLVRANTALSENIFTAASFSIKNRGGFFLNEPTGKKNPNLDLLTGRIALRFLPSDSLDITLSADFTDQDQRSQPRDNVCDATFSNGVHCVGINPDPRITNAVFDGRIKRKLAVYRGEIVLETPIGELTSLTAYRTAKLAMDTLFFSNPINLPAQAESIEYDREDDKQFSQELRLAFGDATSFLDGQVGVYYLSEKIRRTQTLDQYLPIPGRSGTAAWPQSVNARSKAVFGQFNLHPTDRLTLTAGARMTWEKKFGTLGGEVVDAPGFPIPLSEEYEVAIRDSWKAFTPRVALEYELTDRILAYASATRGYKSGGYQGIAGTAASARVSFDPEYAWTYEIGVKSRFADDRAQLNIAAFRTDYKDLQISQLVPFVGVVVGNAATARIQGLEVEAVVRPAPFLQFDGNYTYLDSEFRDFADGATADYTGNRLPRAPVHKINLGLQLNTDIGGWQATGRVDVTRQSHFFFEASNVPAQRQDAYSNIDARVTFRDPSDRWSIAFWGKNLNDTLVKTYVTAFGPFQQQLIPYAPPRTYGVTLGLDL